MVKAYSLGEGMSESSAGAACDVSGEVILRVYYFAGTSLPKNGGKKENQVVAQKSQMGQDDFIRLETDGRRESDCTRRRRRRRMEKKENETSSLNGQRPFSSFPSLSALSAFKKPGLIWEELLRAETQR